MTKRGLDWTTSQQEKEAKKLFASKFPCPDLTRGSIAMPPEEGGVEKVGEDIPSP